MKVSEAGLALQNQEIKDAVRRLCRELAEEESLVWKLRCDEIDLWRRHESRAVIPDDEVVARATSVLETRLPLMLAEVAKLDEADREREALRSAATAAAERVADMQSTFRDAEDEIARRIVSGDEVTKLERQERKLRSMLAKSDGWREELSPVVASRLAAYDADPIFSYLRSRDFGRDGYRARWPVSRLDAVLARWSGYDAARAALDTTLSYEETYASNVASVERAIQEIGPRRQSVVARIKAELETVREDLAQALIETSGVTERFAACTARKAVSISKLREFAAGRDKAYSIAADALVMVTARERAAAAMRSSDPSAVGPGSSVAVEVDANVRQRLATGRRVDGIRRNLSGLLDRLDAVQSVLDAAASGDIDQQEYEFLLASNEVELA